MSTSSSPGFFTSLILVHNRIATKNAARQVKTVVTIKTRMFASIQVFRMPCIETSLSNIKKSKKVIASVEQCM